MRMAALAQVKETLTQRGLCRRHFTVLYSPARERCVIPHFPIARTHTRTTFFPPHIPSLLGPKYAAVESPIYIAFILHLSQRPRAGVLSAGMPRTHAQTHVC